MPISGLAPPANSATLLKDMEFIFEDQWKSRTEPDLTLFSPLYDGRVNPLDDPFPYVESNHLHVLLEVMQEIITIWLASGFSEWPPSRNATSVLEPLQIGVLTMPSAHVPSLPCSGDYVYECCRLISVLMVRSFQARCSWKAMAARNSLLPQLREALHKTDLGGFWGNRLGLLYWVILVFHCAAFGTPDYLLGHAVQTRIHFELTYSRTDWHGAVKPMIALKDIILLCDDQKSVVQA
jgi:hypothetical protein